MTPFEGPPPPNMAGEINPDSTLESVIAQSGGDTSQSYIVIKDNTPVGTLDMIDLVKALVPRVASEAGARNQTAP